MINIVKRLAETAGQKRLSRVLLVVLGCLGLAALCLILGLGWGLWDAARSVGSQEWLLPMFLAVFFAVMAVFAPFIPLWMVNVPDNEVWMILDSTDHLERFVGSGVHPVRPVQGFAPYPQKGVVPVTVELEQAITSDHFPYHVTVNVMATLNPLNADKNLWKTLRNITKEVIANGIRNDVIDIVKRHLYQYGRQDIDPPTLMNTIGDAIREAVAARSNMGVALMPGNSIKISLEPPKEVLASRNELWAEESKAEARVKHLVELLKLSGAHNLSVGELGRLHFLMNPQVGMRLNVQGGHDLFPNAQAQSALPAPKPLATPDRQPIQMPKIEAPAALSPGDEMAVTMHPPPADTMLSQEGNMPPNRPPEPPPDLPEPIPPRPAKKDSDVIETVQDENGTYVPRNPILRPRKSKTGQQRRPGSDEDK